MKKNYLNLLIALVIINWSATAQLTPFYSFAQYPSGSYVPIAGGFTLGTNFDDDQVYVDPNNLSGTFNPASGPGFPIGFNFQFNGIMYDVIGVSNNGWISLGQASLGIAAVNTDLGGQFTFSNPMSFNNSSAPLALQAKIAGFATDLQQQSGSVLSVETIGTAPMRVLVVQYSNYREHFNSGEDINFQIRLNETSNIVDVVFGNVVLNNSQGANCQVGLRGNASTSDFNLRDVTSVSSWTMSTAGANISTNADYINFTPGLGDTYRWVEPPPCSAIPDTNTIIATSTVVCPNTGFTQLTLADTYTNTAISYAWQSSTVSASGPFTNIGTNHSVTTPTANTTTWYQLEATCNGVGATTISAIQVDIANTTTNSVPYFESFEGTNSDFNFLPNCSWNRTDTTSCKTSNMSNFGNRFPHSGNGFAFFDGTNGSANTVQFFSNGIQLNAGVTYSASVWFVSQGFPTLNNFSLSYGLNQSSSGLISLSSIASPMSINSNYSSLSNTFVVTTSGIYYVCVEANTNNSFSFLTIDDLSVTAPCTFTQNAANVNLSAPAAICFGEMANLVATGVDEYNWNTGSNANNISVTPSISTLYSVVGTNALSGCVKTLSAQVVVNPIPAISILPSQFEVCEGSSVQLIATGANSYSWDIGSVTPVVVVSPSTTTIYNVTGTNVYGCNANISQQIIVNDLPSIAVAGSTNICVGDAANLNAIGANSYVWKANNLYLETPFINPIVTSSNTYTLIGTNAQGCSSSITFSIIANICLGVESLENTSNYAIVYPNPNNGEFTIESNNASQKTFEVTDVTGRIVEQFNSENDKVDLNIKNLAVGIYYVKIKSNDAVEILKVIKQ